MTPFLAVCDPPWNADAGGGGRGAQNHYGLEGVDGIAHAMRSAPPWRDTGPGLLWMWATSSAFVTGDAAVVARALGFRPCAGWVWAKVDELHCGGCQGLGDFGPLTSARETCPVCRGFGSVFLHPARLGLGQWQRTEHEHLLLCRRGDVSVPEPSKRPRSMSYAPRGAHSAKPPEAWAVIEQVSRSSLGADVRGVEFFARTQRPGWGAFGTLDGPHTPPRFVEASP